MSLVLLRWQRTRFACKLTTLFYIANLAQYNLTTPSWTEFLPTSNPNSPSLVHHFNQNFELTPLPVAVPAILSFLTLVNKSSSPSPVPHPTSSLKSIVHIKPSSEWDCEWARCVSLSQMEYDSILSEIFKPGRYVTSNLTPVRHLVTILLRLAA